MFPFNNHMVEYANATKRGDIANYAKQTFQSSTSSRLTNKWPAEPKVSLIGSCTNSSYEDISRSASIAKEAKDHRLQVTSKFIITPGSEQVRVTIERKSQIAALEKVGGLVLAKAYSPEETRKRMKTDMPTLDQLFTTIESYVKMNIQ
ncbi:hypothetical protein HGRIS_001368 [Hohenbuehelia grisea]|uniref:Aconitase/3-isopropylmalate dehydratase large subunit alpha/beta/alpha domain-containing protein n=1 Tax=Hohenbuehelia grisea TaxID=104357 RepID=A0ABR3JP36_9AGAR